MTPIHILAPSILTCALVSCASQKPDPYNTPAPSGAGDYAQANPEEAVNPVYDTPAAYEETGSATSASNPPSAVYQSPIPNQTSYTAPASAPSNGAAIIHTVVAGDTLSGISSKYKIPSTTIKQANNMTSDVVVLGRKMVIPPAN